MNENKKKKFAREKPIIFQWVEKKPVYLMCKDEEGNEVQRLIGDRIYNYKVNMKLYNELMDKGLQSWQFDPEKGEGEGGNDSKE
jgi:hypothetical protein